MRFTPRPQFIINVWRRLVPLIIIFAAIFYAVPNALAISISPLRYIISLEAGKTRNLPVTVKNDELKTVIVRLGAIGVKQDEKGRPVLGKNFDIAEAWARPATSTFALAAGQTRIVNYEVKVPLGAYPGEHTIGLTAQSYLPDGPPGLTAQAATLASLIVAGRVTESAVINLWQPRFLISTLRRWDFNFQLYNSGTVAVPLAGKIIIKDAAGKTLGEHQLALGNVLLPSTSLTLQPGLEANEAINYFLPKLYRADVVIVYGHSKSIVSQSARVWYWPPAGIIGLALIITSGIWLIKKYWRRKK